MPVPGPRIIAFDGWELDPARFELRRDGERVPVEPQVLSLLILLAGNRDRMVGKDEIIDEIWDGRIVSESAVAARIKSARKAIGDDGKSQRFIRTIHGRGFRFVCEASEIEVDRESSPARVIAVPESMPSSHPGDGPTMRGGRPSIAVLPFSFVGPTGGHDIIADALPADILFDLSRFTWLFVIARGSSFRFRGPDVDPVEVGRKLMVGYCLAGSIELADHEASVAVALEDARSGTTVWAETYRGALADLQHMRPEIEASVVVALEVHIPRNEVRIARGRPTRELDAWASLHLGLDHMYRFNRDDNQRAAEYFRLSLDLEPHFSRALGGLSFTHFQNAFLRFARDRDAEMDAARTFAHRAVEADRVDPFAHFSVGRSLWLDGRLKESLEWFDRSTALSPNFAQGVYNRGLVATMIGEVDAAEADISLALELSPIDPLAYAMVSSRALIKLEMGELGDAADIADRAARMPGAHRHIALIAALTARLAGRHALAQEWLARARSFDPAIGAEVFFRSFPFAQTRARELIERSLSDMGV